MSLCDTAGGVLLCFISCWLLHFLKGLYPSCRWVDEVVKDAPWVLDIDFINKHKIDYVTHDALPYSDASGQANDVYDFVSNLAQFRSMHSLHVFLPAK